MESPAYRMTCFLHGQKRRFDIDLVPHGDSLCVEWGIERNLRGWRGSYTMGPEALENAERLSFRMPEDGNRLILSGEETFVLMPRAGYRGLRDKGRTVFNGSEYRLLDSLEVACSRMLLHARDIHEGAEIWVLNDPERPLVWRMEGNPLEVDWSFESLDPDYLAVKADPTRAGGTYHAYPYVAEGKTPVPASYEAFYVSHYGRHGSRYLTRDDRYLRPLEFYRSQLRAGNLTPLGEDFLNRLETLWSEVEGKGGQLSEIGERQHKEIAGRLMERYPSLFVSGAVVEASSSTSGRCVASMEAFCDSLLTACPGLSLTRRSDEETMALLVPRNPAIDSLDSETSLWRTTVYEDFKASHIHPQRLLRSLLRDVSRVPDPMAAASDLYYLATGMQDIPSAVDFDDLFTPEELYGALQCVDTRMYYVNVAGTIGPQSVRPLLKDILDKADAAVSGAAPAVATLRFGHDSILIRLLSLLGVRECAARAADIGGYADAWVGWQVSPMAANLQMVFLRDRRGYVLVKLLLNERETSIPALGEGPYYDWDAFRAYAENLL